MHNYQEIIDYWINQVGFEGWFEFKASPAKELLQFEDWLEHIEDFEEWKDQPLSCLAYIILTDQFPRLLFAGNAKAYETDKLAQAACLNGLALLPKLESASQKMSFLMPLMHAENVQLQKFSILHSKKLSTTESTVQTQTFFQRAIRHHNEIERFGRFPIRNRDLNREPTEDEIKFVSEISN